MMQLIELISMILKFTLNNAFPQYNYSPYPNNYYSYPQQEAYTKFKNTDTQDNNENICMSILKNILKNKMNEIKHYYNHTIQHYDDYYVVSKANKVMYKMNNIIEYPCKKEAWDGDEIIQVKIILSHDTATNVVSIINVYPQLQKTEVAHTIDLNSELEDKTIFNKTLNMEEVQTGAHKKCGECMVMRRIAKKFHTIYKIMGDKEVLKIILNKVAVGTYFSIFEEFTAQIEKINNFGNKVKSWVEWGWNTLIYGVLFIPKLIWNLI